MAIADDFTIDYTDKTVKHTSGTTIYSVNALYSYLQDEFDQPGQMDDQVPMSAQTPTEYSLINGWFMDDTSMQFLNGGAIQTVGWQDGTTWNVVQIPYSPNSSLDFIASDIGKQIFGYTTGDTGTILDYNTTRRFVWVRPDDPESGGDRFDVSTEVFAVEGGTGEGSLTGIAVTGETTWANVFSLGTLEDSTDLYIGQEDDAGAFEAITSFWVEGQIDVLVKTREKSTLIDGGRLVVYRRQYSKNYDHFETTIASNAGGRNPIPLATSDDLNNTTGFRNMTFTGGDTGIDLAIDEIFADTGETDKAGIALSAAGTAATGNFDYYLIGNGDAGGPLTDFVTSDTILGETLGKDMTVGTVSANGPSDAPDNTITITFANAQYDLNNGFGPAEYTAVIDAQTLTLATVYERVKYITRFGETTIQINGVDGQLYVGIGDILLNYTAETTTVLVEGEEIQDQGDSTISGTIVSRHDAGGSAGFLIVRNVKGTFTAAATIVGQTSAGQATVNGSTETITPTKASPFGTFAGGTFFGARGVYVDDRNANDTQNFQFVDSNGNTQIPPNTVTITVAGLSVDDVAFVSEVVTPGDVDIRKDTWASHASNNSAGDITFEVSTNINTLYPDTPQAGQIRVVDVSTETEQRYRYASWTGAIFTLEAEITGVSSGPQSATALEDEGAYFTTSGVKVGDTIRNTTSGDSAVIVSITDDDNIVTTALVGAGDGFWDPDDTWSVHTLDRAYVAADTVYAPIIDDKVTAGSTLTNTLIYDTSSGDIDVVGRVRQGKVILPFESTGISVDSGGLTINAIRTTDTIAT